MSKDISVKKERGERARFIRSMTGLTAPEFALEANVARRSILGWESGTSGGGLTEKGAEKIIMAAKKHGVIANTVWLLHGLGAQPLSTNKTFSKSVSLEPPTLDSSKNFQIKEFKDNIKQEITCFFEHNPDAITLQILDNAMEPYFNIGDIVGGKKVYNADIKTVVTKFCIAETENHSLLCRQVTQGEEDNLFNLSCTNPHTDKISIHKNQKLISAAPVIWIRKMS